MPKQVYTDLYTGITVMDSEYGVERDYMKKGGYSLVLEAVGDLAEFKSIIDYEAHPCEWATKISRETGYLSALYLLNNDFAIVAYMPISLPHDAILKDLEEEV